MQLTANTDRDRVQEATDLVQLIGEHITLRQKGREHVGLCPFHDDRTPSMHVVTHKSAHFYKCFACGAHGSAFDFVMNYHKMEFIDALRFLAERANIELTSRNDEIVSRESGDQPERLPRRDLIQANETALSYFRAVLEHPKAGEPARDAATNRGLAQETIESFQIGAAPDDWEALSRYVAKHGLDTEAFHQAGLLRRNPGGGTRDTFVNRLLFPICDQLGRPIAFGGRILNPEDQPKYLNSPESLVFNKSKTLYGLHLARRAITESKVAVVTEGYTDVIAMHQAGMTNVVATLGTALTREHANLLQKLCETVVLLFDGDQAGRKAADRAVEVFFAEPIDVSICILPDGADPDDMVRTGPDGIDQLKKHLACAEPALPYLLRQFQVELNETDSLSGKQKRTEALLARLADLGFSEMPGIRKRLILPEIAQLLGVSVHDLEARIPRRRRGPDKARVSVETKPDEAASSDDPVPERLVASARRIAEENLLAILVFEPDACQIPVDTGEGHFLPLAEAYPPEAFHHPWCRQVYQVIHDHLEAEESFSVSRLQQRVEGDQARRLVTTLYFKGSDLCGAEETKAAARLAEATSGFDRVRDQELYNERVQAIRQAPSPGDECAPTAASSSFLQIVQERRSHGDNPAAFPRGHRAT